MTSVRRNKADWAGLIREFEASSESAARFAAKLGVAEATLKWWQSRLRRESASKQIPFVDVEVAVQPPARPLLVLVGGTTHRVVVPDGFDACELRRLVDALC
jgi:hypothetical protein